MMLPTLVEAQLKARPLSRHCYYCDCSLALEEDDVVVTPWGAIYVRPGLELPTTDHRLPVSRGGTDALENLVLACRSCNSAKGAKTVEEFFPIAAQRMGISVREDFVY
jgi:hypothetical protein